MKPNWRRRRRRPRGTPNMTHWDEAQKADFLHQQRLRTPVANMLLSVRIINTLEAYRILYAGEICQLSYHDLMSMRNFGETTLREVQTALRKIGLSPPKLEAPCATNKCAKAHC